MKKLSKAQSYIVEMMADNWSLIGDVITDRVWLQKNETTIKCAYRTIEYMLNSGLLNKRLTSSTRLKFTLILKPNNQC